MARFGAVLTAMVTPFTADGELDGARAAELARWLVDRGNDGLVLAGTTGESPVLTDEERTELWRVVREAVDVPLVAGSTTNDTAHSVAMTQAAHELGMDGILAVTPYYNRPSQAGLEAHFRAVAVGQPVAGAAVRHPGPHGPQDQHRADGAPGRGRPHHHRGEGRGAEPGRDGPVGVARARTTSRCTAATTR